jgi:uncharacterized protein
MKIEKLIIGILIISLFSCNNSKKTEDKTQPPKVEFDFSDMPKNYEVGPDTYVNDLEKIFTKNQIEELEKLLVKLQKESGKKILILTVPSKDKLNKNWSIDNGFTNSGIIITVSESLKNVGIGIAKDTKDILPESTREKIIKNTIIPEFENGNYYGGINKGIEEILNSWK